MLRVDGRTEGRMHTRTDNVKTVYPQQAKFLGGIIICISNYHIKVLYLQINLIPDLRPCHTTTYSTNVCRRKEK